MFHQGPEAESVGGGAGVEGRVQVPHLDLAVIGARHDALVVETDAPNLL